MRCFSTETGVSGGEAAARDSSSTWPGLAQPLEGERVTLEPLSERHRDPLYEASRDPEIWLWLDREAGAGRAGFDGWFDARMGAAEAGLECPFATLSSVDGSAIGSSTYLNLRPEHRGLEIGWTWVAPSSWRSGANVEAKLLMLGHAFEDLGCIRVEFKTDARNERSRGALAALRATFEGILRKHMLPRGVGERDSAYFSVLDDEWPAVKANLEARLESVGAAHHA
jgi:RimJ/RimL family protein N-acetyltransferase